MPKVLNKYKDGMPKGAVYIGRPSKWGNPFAMSEYGTREMVISKYKEWLISQPLLIEEAKRELAGKDLICFCSPKACHGDVLLEVANAPKLTLRMRGRTQIYRGRSLSMRLLAGTTQETENDTDS